MVKGKSMEPFYWETDESHWDNEETMSEYLEEFNTLDNPQFLEITLVDGTYAEGKNKEGQRYAIHAYGNGDSFNHIVEFELIDDVDTGA
jgi:hypothetical protein